MTLLGTASLGFNCTGSYKKECILRKDSSVQPLPTASLKPYFKRCTAISNKALISYYPYVCSFLESKAWSRFS